VPTPRSDRREWPGAIGVCGNKSSVLVEDLSGRGEPRPALPVRCRTGIRSGRPASCIENAARQLAAAAVAFPRGYHSEVTEPHEENSSPEPAAQALSPITLQLATTVCFPCPKP
jgi:hypothetical protein